MKNNKNQSALDVILDWSEGRPDWQRDALRRIVQHGSVPEEEMEEIVNLAKRENGDESIQIEPTPLISKHLPPSPAMLATASLTGISDVIGVNQLAQGQILTFDPTGITVIYGQNGSGKSGYIRILKRACMSRNAGSIVPNVYEASPPDPSARISAIVGGTEEVFDWLDEDEPIEQLATVTVFDRDAGVAHVRDRNEVFFRPFGLDIPDELAGAVVKVKEILDGEKNVLEGQRNAVFDAPIWSAGSSIGLAMGSLSAKSDLALVFDGAALAAIEVTRLQQLEIDLTKDPESAAAEQKASADGIAGLAGYARRESERLSDAQIATIRAVFTDASDKRTAADAAASVAFGDLQLDCVGEGAWQEMWNAARRYSTVAGTEGIEFPPNAGDVCVLCHQDIGEDVADRMKQFDEFIASDTEEQAANAENRLAEVINNATRAKIDVRPHSAAYRDLKNRSPELAISILRILSVTRARRKLLVDTKYVSGLDKLPPLPTVSKSDIDELIADIRSYADTLANTENPELRKALEVERDNLKDRQNAESLRPIAEAEVERLGHLDQIEKCLTQTATHSITTLGNKIADEIITPLMRDRFQEEIVRLAESNVRVEVVRSGGKYGSPQYQVRLIAAPNNKVHTVLSEGEQTCVALAAYLTELANTSNKSALVFDDPVTSLDSRWRSRVAERLIEEASNRQIIVFTHDLVFLNDLANLATESQIKVKFANLTKGGQGIGIVNDDLPWRAAKISERIDLLEKMVREARSFYESGDEERYRDAGLKFYDRLRSAWERALEDRVFCGVVVRHRDYINTRHLKKVTALTEADVQDFHAVFQRCSGFIPSHDKSRARDEEIPPPNELDAEIGKLKTWEADLRKRQNDLT